MRRGALSFRLLFRVVFPRQVNANAVHSEEVEVLREQNRVLLEQLRTLRPAPQTELKEALGTSAGTERFLSKVQAHLESEQFLSQLDRNMLLTRPSVAVLSDPHADEVGVIDLDAIDWWTLVPSSTSAGAVVDNGGLSGPFVWVDHDDVVAAVAETIAIVLRKSPEAASLDNRALQQKLVTTFVDLRQAPSPLGSLWETGTKIYRAYGWATMALQLYRDPALVLAVLRVLYSSCRWLLL